MIYKIQEILNESNSSKDKLAKLEQTKCDELARLFKLTYDLVKYTFNIKMTNISLVRSGDLEPSIEIIDLQILRPLYTRELTGNAARDHLQSWFDKLTERAQEVLKCIIERDLRVNISSKTINKVYKNLIFELPYMRCSLMDSVDRVSYPALLQEKMDGTYRTLIKQKDSVQWYSRSGESYEHLLDVSDIPDGVYIGEMIAKLDDNMNAKDIRYKSNGLLNSLESKHTLVTFYVWDYLSYEDFINGKCTKPYYERYNKVLENIRNNDNILAVQTTTVYNLDEALDISKTWISQGKEGGVLKDLNTPFENKTSKTQIKIKRILEIDLKVTGFEEGKGKRANTFGSILVESSDGKLKTKVSGFTDEELVVINSNREKYINTVMAVECSDISKAKDSDTYSVLYPRFKGIRPDKDVADDLDRILSILDTKEVLEK